MKRFNEGGGIEKEFQDKSSREELLVALLLCPFARQCIVKSTDVLVDN